MRTVALGAVRVLAPLAAFVALLLAWQVGVERADVSALLLPSPSVIAAQTREDLDYLLRLTWRTALDAGQGTLLGVLLAVPAAWAVHTRARLSQVTSSLSTALKAVPIVALFPIATVFLGSGSGAVVAVVTLSTLPIAFTYTLSGLRQASALDDVMHVLAAGRLRRFWSVRLPVAAPFLLTGIRTALPLSVITAIVAEYFGGPVTSLGTYIRQQSANLHTTEMWSAIVFSCLLGLVAAGIGALASRGARRLEGSVSR